MGLDGIVQSQYACSAVALEDSDVCVVHMNELNSVGQAIPELQQHVQKIMSREIVRDHDLFLLLGSMRSDGRIASFIINLLARLQARGQSGDAVHLRMTREDIGSYLGLTIETVSRTLNKFARNGIINLEQKDIRVLDLPALHALTQHDDHKNCVQHALHTPLPSVAMPLKQRKVSVS